MLCVKHGGSAVECRTHNRQSLGSNPFCYCFKVCAFSFFPRLPSSLSCINEYPAVDGDGNMIEYSSRVKFCCVARMLLGEVELVLELTGLQGSKV